MWIANPHTEIRKKTSFYVVLFLIICGVLVYSMKRRIWHSLDKENKK